MTFVGTLEYWMGANEVAKKEGEKVSKKFGIGCILWKGKDKHEKETKITEPFTGKRKKSEGKALCRDGVPAFSHCYEIP